MNRKFGYEIGISASALRKTGQDHLNNDNPNEAIAIFKYAVEKHPSDAFAHVTLGQAYEKNSQLELAKETYKKAYEIALSTSHPQVKWVKNFLDRVIQMIERGKKTQICDYSTAQQVTAGTIDASHGQDSRAPESDSIKVPEGDGRPVLLDGLFSPGEWDDAKKVDIHQNVSLYLKKYSGHVFVGIKINPYRTSVVDMFISPDGKMIRHLHASAQIGERVVNENSEPWDNPSFIWGYSVDWYANEIRWDNEKMQGLIKKGKNRNEGQELSYFTYDGFEFQIKQSKFSSDRWWFRIEVPMAPGFDDPVIYPRGSEMKSTKGWIRLELD